MLKGSQMARSSFLQEANAKEETIETKEKKTKPHKITIE